MIERKVTPPLFKLGDRVKVLHASGMRARIVELRGPLAPGGMQVYRIRAPQSEARLY